MNKILTKFELIIRNENYSDNTIKNYLSYVDKYITSMNKDAYQLTQKDLENYLLAYNFSSVSQQNQIISSLRLFYNKILKTKLRDFNLKRPRTEKKLPKVIDSETILNNLSKIENLKHKTILSLTYSVGLRVSEVHNLKITDIDSKRMLISVINGKGRKDRIVPLSQKVLELLRIYYKEYKPKEYLFNGQNSNKYSIKSIQTIYKKYIDDKTSIHNLRHSCFTNLLEAGTNLRIIQKIAGHSNIKTTEIYTHVSNNLLSKVKLPI
jgi:site-specific recombinase XerD